MIPLLTLQPGEVGRIERMDLASGTKKRLFELGLHTGARVTMKKNDRGPIILHVHHATIALGRPLCQRIYVTRHEYGGAV